MSIFRYDIVRAPDDSQRTFNGLFAGRTFFPVGEISRDRQGSRTVASLVFRAFELRPLNDQLSVGNPWSYSVGLAVFEDATTRPGCGGSGGVFTINYPSVPPAALANGVFFFGKQAVQYVVQSGQTIVMNGLIQVQRQPRFPRGPIDLKCTAGGDGTNGGNF